MMKKVKRKRNTRDLTNLRRGRSLVEVLAKAKVKVDLVAIQEVQEEKVQEETEEERDDLALPVVVAEPAASLLKIPNSKLRLKNEN
jgi:hypothetical protein